MDSPADIAKVSRAGRPLAYLLVAVAVAVASSEDSTPAVLHTVQDLPRDSSK